VDYLIVALVAGLAAVERKGFLQAMLSRPVALAPFTGLALGDLHGGLMLGPPLELLWLGAVNLGAALPPQEALGAAAIAGGAVLAGRALGTGVTPAVACLTLALVGTLATLGRTADRAIEEWNVRLAGRADARVAQGELRAAARANLQGLVLPFAVSSCSRPSPPRRRRCSCPPPCGGSPGRSGRSRSAGRRSPGSPPPPAPGPSGPRGASGSSPPSWHSPSSRPAC